jgi:murein DD-endopeptidase MepM/ murein hydrolase activator NlpD
MRLGIAVAGTTAFLLIGVVAVATRPAPRESSVIAAVPSPYATADPAVTSRVDPDLERGRLARDDRESRAMPVVRGLIVPIEGASLPSDPDLLPNAPRDFRAGWHEGIDFPAPAGTPVRAVAAGTVIRVDRDFIDWERATREIALYDAVQLGYTPAATLDRIRGRQVWIDHGGGIVSRYAHLSAVADLSVGVVIEAGTVVGAVGSSGYPEGGPHLHLEIRVGTSYLGDGLSGQALLDALSRAFD